MRNLCYIYVNKNARTGEKKKTTRERERDHQLADCRVGCGFCVWCLSLSRVYVFVCFFVAALFRLKKRQKSKNFFQRFEIKINVVAREMGLSWPKRNGTPRSFLFGVMFFRVLAAASFLFARLPRCWWRGEGGPGGGGVKCCAKLSLLCYVMVRYAGESQGEPRSRAT